MAMAKLQDKNLPTQQKMPAMTMKTTTQENHFEIPEYLSSVR